MANHYRIEVWKPEHKITEWLPWFLGLWGKEKPYVRTEEADWHRTNPAFPTRPDAKRELRRRERVARMKSKLYRGKIVALEYGLDINY